MFTSDRAPLGKEFRLADGQISKTSHATLYAGTAETRRVATAHALADLLEGLTPRQALASGILISGTHARIGTKAKARKGEKLRSLADFHFRPAAGWLLWDFDAKTMPAAVAARIAELGGPLRAFFHLWPEAEAGPYVIRPSSSDGVTAPGCDAIRSAGLHGFFLIEDVSQSKAVLETLQERAWAEGLAWYALSKSGAALERSIVDTTVGSPERLIFEAPPILRHPITRQPSSTIVHDAPTPLAAPATPLEVAGRAKRAEADARSAIKPEAKQVEEAFVEERAQAEVRRMGKTIQEARVSVRRMLRGAVLEDDHLLQLGDGSWIRVGAILDDAARWHRRSIPDPVEGIAYGTDKATLLLLPRDGHPDEKAALVSHAHGQRTVYRFARYESGPEPLQPVHPGPDPSIPREEGIGRAHQAIARWGRRSGRMALATREMAQQLEDRLPFATNQNAETRRIALEVKQRHDLPRRPQAAWGKRWAGERIQITGAMGIGKTGGLVGVKDHRTGERRPGALHDGLGLVSVFFAPDHEKAAEAFRDYLDNAPTDRTCPPAVHLRGRSAQSPDRLGQMCELAELAEAAAQRGVNVRQTMCTSCPFREDCAYLRMVDEIGQAVASDAGAVIFAPHDYAFLSMPVELQGARYIVDERPRDYGLRKAEVGLDEWAGDLRHLLSGKGAASTADALADLLALIRPALTAIARFLIESPETAREKIAEAALRLAEDSDEGDPSRVLRRVAGSLTQFLDERLERQIAATMMGPPARIQGRPASLATRLERVIEAGEDRHVRPMIDIIRALAVELGQTHGTRLQTVKVEQRGTKPPRIVARWIARATIPASAPLLHLDGTGDPLLARAWFSEIEHVHCPVERLGEAVFVDGHSFSTTSLTGLAPSGNPFNADRAENHRSRLHGVLAREPGAFVCMALKALEAMGPLPNHKTAYFGALRGRNLAEGCEVAFVIGRSLPKLSDVEELAAAFAVALDLPFTPIPPPGEGGPPRFPRRPEGLRMADGKAHGITLEYHPDPLGQVLLRQLRDAETTQAVDRVRAMFVPKRIYVMGTSIPDVTFARIEQWAEFHKGGSKVARALARGVLPLSYSEAARVHPDIWANRKAAQRDTDLERIIERSKAALASADGSFEWDIRYIESFYTGCPTQAPERRDRRPAVLATYLRPANGARGWARVPTPALIMATTAEAEATLEALAGPVVDFRIEAYSPEAEPRPAPAQEAQASAVMVRLPSPVPIPINVPAQPLRPVAGAGPPG